jgi:hypothetical protein
MSAHRLSGGFASRVPVGAPWGRLVVIRPGPSKQYSRKTADLLPWRPATLHNSGRIPTTRTATCAALSSSDAEVERALKEGALMSGL